MINKIDKIFKKTGLYKANYIYIYSDFRIFFKTSKTDPIKLTKTFLELFTKKGITCIIPSFSYTIFGNFVVEETKSKLGFLANFIIKNFDHERSEHPLFSFVAIGKNKKIVKNIGKSAFGKDSVHSRLYNNNAFFLYFFRPLKEGNTLVHHIEKINKAPYRFEKKFVTKVYKNKKYIGKNYSAYLRKDIDNKKFNFTFRKVLKKINDNKYIKLFRVRNSEIAVINYDYLYQDLFKLYKKDSNIFIKSGKN
jgi:aminoglycoside 3-N-acetyltransferase